MDSPALHNGQLKHSHIFDNENPIAEKRTIWAVILTVITELHLWRIGKPDYSCIIALVTPEHMMAEEVKKNCSNITRNWLTLLSK